MHSKSRITNVIQRDGLAKGREEGRASASSPRLVSNREKVHKEGGTHLDVVLESLGHRPSVELCERAVRRWV